MSITIISAIDKNRGIGKNNDLLWYLPEDLKFFKKETLNKVVVMGRKTYESLPVLLKSRWVWILSSKYLPFLPLNYRQFYNLTELVNDMFKESQQREIMIAGGGTIYKELLPVADRLLLTELDAVFDADIFFPEFIEEFEETRLILNKLPDARHMYGFNIKEYKRK